MTAPTPPHFPRLLETLESIVAPIVVLWAPAGSGKRAFLAWLKERDDPEVIAYLEAENAYLEKVMADEKEMVAVEVAEIEAVSELADKFACLCNHYCSGRCLFFPSNPAVLP